MKEQRVRLRHGSGGAAMRELIDTLLVDPSPVEAATGDDGAIFPAGEGSLVFSTDAHVVQPRFFSGGDIGRLAVCGTVNDLAVMGGTEILGLATALVLEEGFSMEELGRIQASVFQACREAGTSVVTGDTKVVGRGEVDGLVITASGVARAQRPVIPELKPGDSILVSGSLGDHGMAVMVERNGIEVEGELRSDVAPLNGLVAAVLEAGGSDVVALKDPTRGGLNSCLHELGERCSVGFLLEEVALPVSESVRSCAELFGIDPLSVANEGKVVVGVRAAAVEAVLEALRAHPLGGQAAKIGCCTSDQVGRVILDTGFGRRLLAEPDGALLPRIC